MKALLGAIVGAPGTTNATLYADESRVHTMLGNAPDHAAIALRAARESVVLLKNDARPAGGSDRQTSSVQTLSTTLTLPLDRRAVTRLLVLGPNADEARMGDYR